jgi:hypothetical protein
MKKPVKLKVGHANPHLQGLSKQGGDTAEWISEDVAYILNFSNDNPFVNGPVFHVPALGSVDSGPIKAGAAEKEYHYDLRRAGSAAGGDPDVEILP